MARKTLLFIPEEFDGVQNINDLGARISWLFSGVHPTVTCKSLRPPTQNVVTRTIKLNQIRH